MSRMSFRKRPCNQLIEVSLTRVSRKKACDVIVNYRYHKIPKKSPGAYLRRENCVSQSIELALKLEGNLPFLLCFAMYLRTISNYNPPGAGGLIFGGAI